MDEITEIEQRIAEKQALVPAPSEHELIDKAVQTAGRQANTLKDVVDIGVTGLTLKKEGVIEELTSKKEQELKEDALAKVIASEVDRIAKETAKVLEEGKKQLAELENQITAAQAEKEKLDKEADKNEAYFKSHKSVLKYGGCTEAMSMRSMQFLTVMGFIIMGIVKVLFAPLILVGLFIEILMDIVNGVADKVKHNTWKIIISMGLIILIIGAVTGIYFGIAALI